MICFRLKMNKLKTLYNEIIYQLEDFIFWLTWKFRRKRRLRLRKLFQEITTYLIAALLIILLLTGNTPIIHGDTVINITEPTSGISEVQSVELGKAIKEVIRVECEKQGVPESLVYAIINSPDPTEDRLPRYGVMKLHPDLINKYNANYPDGMGIVMSIYSNVVSGVERLAWCLDNNASIEGALMVYIYTKPQAQEMWGQGIKTTDWVEAVKELMK